MKKFLSIIVMCVFYSTNVLAQGIEFAETKVRQPIPGMSNTSGYGSLTNTSNKAITFVKASSPLAQRVEFHDHTMKDGVMKMVKLEKITVKSNETLQFVSGGLHLMFLDVHSMQHNKDKIPVSLYTESGQVITHDFNFVSIHNEEKHCHH